MSALPQLPQEDDLDGLSNEELLALALPLLDEPVPKADPVLVRSFLMQADTLLASDGRLQNDFTTEDDPEKEPIDTVVRRFAARVTPHSVEEASAQKALDLLAAAIVGEPVFDSVGAVAAFNDSEPSDEAVHEMMSRAIASVPDSFPEPYSSG